MFEQEQAELADALSKGDLAAAREVSHRLAGLIKSEARVIEPTEANFDGIQHAALRRAVDPPINKLAESLSDAYYKFWRRGLSHPWHGHDVQGTPAASKALFDELHGLIYHQREIDLAAANETAPARDRIPTDDLKGDDGRAKRVIAEEKIAEAAQRGVALPQRPAWPADARVGR